MVKSMLSGSSLGNLVGKSDGEIRRRIGQISPAADRAHFAGGDWEDFASGGSGSGSSYGLGTSCQDSSHEVTRLGVIQKWQVGPSQCLRRW